MMKKITEPRKFSYTFGFRSTGNVGSMLYTDLCVINDSVDISAMHNKIQTALAISTGTPVNKFAVGGFTATYDIKNSSNVDVICEVYKCVARDDMDSTLSPLANWNNIANIQYAQGPINMMQDGYFEATGGVNLNAATWPLGITPFSINKFSTYFKVLKTSKFKLIGGGIKNVKITAPRWNIWNGTKVKGCTGALDAVDTTFRGKTVFYFMLTRGMPVNDSVVTTKVTTGPPDIDIVGIEQYEYTGIPNAVAKIEVPINGLQTITNAVSFITEQTELKVGVVSA